MSNTMIEAGVLAKAIANHITPIKKGCHVKNIRKATREHPPEHPNNWRHEDLSLADSEMLAEIWRINDLPFNCPIEQADWPKYITAFDNAPNRPDWVLTCGFNDWYIITRKESTDAAIEHQKAIEAASARGELRLFKPNLAPTDKVKPGTLIHRDDAEAYLKMLGLSLDTIEQPPAVTETDKQEETRDAEIFRRSKTETHQSLADEFDVTRQNIGRIVKKENAKLIAERSRLNQPNLPQPKP